MSAARAPIWVMRDQPSAREVMRLTQALGVSRVVATILVTRGHPTPEHAQQFLSATVDQLHDPFLLPGMDKAVRRLKQAIDEGEKILVYGDYDVDGVTGTAMLARFLTALGANATWRIPHRLGDGYGVNESAVRAAAHDGVRLLITADCGITAVHEVAVANSLGVDVIVSDHHEPSSELPAAVAVLNPKHPDTRYPFPDLAGVGVAFKLATAYVREYLPQHETNLQRAFLDLVTLGTVADVMPLVDENRILVREGLKHIPKTRKLGLHALLTTNTLQNKPITTYHIGFVLGPRLNAAGRMDTARLAAELLLTQDQQKAFHLARQLNRLNRQRQEEEKRTLDEAVALVEAAEELPPAVVLGSANWHPGVIGLVASRVVERFYRPTILIAWDGDTGKGSGRSIEAFHLLNALKRCAEHLEKCGGHRLAAGLTVHADKFPTFRQQFCAVADALLSEDDLRPQVKVDCEVNAEEITLRLVEELQQLEPFGVGNPQPLLCLRNAVVVDKSRVGQERQHLKLKVKSEDEVFECVWWRRGDCAEELIVGQPIDLCFSPERNDWGGTSSVQLKVKDIKTVG